MHIYRSNQTELLVDELVEVVSAPLPSPLSPECIVVQAPAMQRWLSLALCRRLGVWANAEFPFPRRMVERALSKLLDLKPDAGQWPSPQVLSWSIFGLLGEYLGHRAFGPVRRHLSGQTLPVRRMKLAQRLARAFDRYALYRPSMLLDWERGKGADWQAILWRALCEKHGRWHLAAQATAFLAAVREGSPRLRTEHGLPSRLSLFGIASLPPLYLEIFSALSQLVEVHIFIVSPSSELHARLRSERARVRDLRCRGADAARFEQDLATTVTEGHPLLASLGRLGREFALLTEALGALGQGPAGEHDRYSDPGTASVLTALQSDMLWLRRRGVGPGQLGPLQMGLEDHSIQVHACHSRMREVEVLHDRLLALFEADPKLEARDVIVMMPDVESYAPYVEAVFAPRGDERPQIPFQIARQNLSTIHRVVDAFEAVLDVLPGRMAATDLLDLLELGPIRERFDLTEQDLEQVHRWVAGSSVRWGVDGEHRRAVGQPAFEQNTWRFGLDRLLLGYAMPGHGQRLFADTSPYDDVEGSDAQVLGRLAEFLETLFGLRQSVSGQHRSEHWHEALSQLLEAMVAVADENESEHQLIRRALDQLVEDCRSAGFDEPLDLQAVRAQLAELLQGTRFTRSAHNLFSGGVGFCSFDAARAIPFQVVCMLGMDDDAFPRRDSLFGLDRMRQGGRELGDPSASDDNRLGFLLALLCARKQVLITYVGQSIRDNAQLPASVLVEELLDAMGESFYSAAESDDTVETASAMACAQRAMRERVVLQHPLQPFSPRYFDDHRDPRLFSYAAGFCQGARALMGQPKKPGAFFSDPLPLQEAQPRVVDLEDLIAFFRHPVRRLLETRVGLRLSDRAEILDDREPFVLDPLQFWQVGEDLLARALRGQDAESAFAQMRASGRLPLGVPGFCALGQIWPQVQRLAARALPYMRDQPLQPLQIDLDVEGVRIRGVIQDLWPRGQVLARFSRLGRDSELALWIRHLVLGCLPSTHHAGVSVLVGRPQKGDGEACVHFRPVSQPLDHLKRLIQLYVSGQSRRLCFLPRASRRFAVEMLGGAEPDESLRMRAFSKARGVLDSPVGSGTDLGDPYLGLAFEEPHPLGAGHLPAVHSHMQAAGGHSLSAVDRGELEAFEKTALDVFGPLLAHRQEQT